MLSLIKLANLTPRDIIKNSHSVVARISRVLPDLDDQGFHYKFFIKAWDRKTKGGTKRILIKMYGEKSDLKSKVWVTCNCEHNKFTCEVVNTLKGSSDIIDSNGRLPLHKNPSLRPQLCKHLIKSIIYIKNYKGEINFDKIDKQAIDREINSIFINRGMQKGKYYKAE